MQIPMRPKDEIELRFEHLMSDFEDLMNELIAIKGAAQRKEARRGGTNRRASLALVPRREADQPRGRGTD